MLSPLQGKLTLTFRSGKDLRRVQMLGKQDPYVQINFDGQKKFTKVCTDGGRFPTWNQSISFDCKNTKHYDVTLTVYNKNVASLDNVIGLLKIPVFDFISNPNGWFPLFRTEHRLKCGEILIESNFVGTGGLPAKQPSRYGILTAKYGVGNCSVDVLSMVQMHVKNLEFVIPGDMDLSDYFKLDPFNNRTDKSLIITYLSGDSKQPKKTVIIKEKLGKNPVSLQFQDFEKRKEEQEAAMKAAEEAASKEREAAILKSKTEAEQRAKAEADIRAKAEEDLKSFRELAVEQEKRFSSEIKDLADQVAELQRNVKAKEQALKEKEKELKNMSQELKDVKSAPKVVVPLDGKTPFYIVSKNTGNVLVPDAGRHLRSDNKNRTVNEQFTAFYHDGHVVIKHVKLGTHLQCTPKGEVRLESKNTGEWEQWSIEVSCHVRCLIPFY